MPSGLDLVGDHGGLYYALAGRREMPAPLHGLRAVFGYD
jgi:hypothetical protein